MHEKKRATKILKKSELDISRFSHCYYWCWLLLEPGELDSLSKSKKSVRLRGTGGGRGSGLY